MKGMKIPVKLLWKMTSSELLVISRFILFYIFPFIKVSCENSDVDTIEHFIDVSKLSKRANNAEIEIKDYKLTRYACYLIAQNGDSRKKVIALAQTYFAVQTRKQKINEKEYNLLTKNEKSIKKYGKIEKEK